MRKWLLAAAAAGVLLLGLVTASGATTPRSPVPQGIAGAAIHNDKVFGQTDPNEQENVSFVLKGQNLDSLTRKVANGWQGPYLSVSDFANQYGQSRTNIAALQAYLARYGISTTVYADGLDVAATGTAGQFNKALSIKQNDYLSPAAPASHGRPARPAKRYHGTPTSPLLPQPLAQFVLAIIGLVNYPTYNSLTVHAPAAASPAAVQNGDLAPADFARHYNLPRGTGAGATIGILALASFDPQVAQDFWSKILGIRTKPNRISVVSIDGGAGPITDETGGSVETTADVEQSGALAPQANIVVYEAPNTDAGFVDTFFAAASDNTADTVSTSWGSSETIIQALIKQGQEPTAYAQVYDEVFLEMAAQGQSSFVASGDSGAYSASADLGTTNLSIGIPDSSPWTTAAGGTTLRGTIPLGPDDSARIRSERTWGWDWLWPHYADFGFDSEADFAFAYPAGGGGGFSAIEPMPSYQQQIPNATRFSAAQYLIPTTPQQIAPGLVLPTEWDFNGTPSVTTGRGSGRAEPDVSANADPLTGYAIYFTFGNQPPQVQDGWGGTSFVAPQLNGATAVIDSLLGKRVGFWNPAIYQFAMQRNSPFTPLSTASADNTNLYYSGTPGNVYNAGSGLGTPDLTQLAADFARINH